MIDADGKPLEPTDALMLMRHVMTPNDVDALDTIADYLASRGRVVESRDIREEAKKANYGNLTVQAGIFDQWSRTMASLVLAPVGYGAKPELALVWLMALWFVSYLIYQCYSVTRRKDWPTEFKSDDRNVEGLSKVPGFRQFDEHKQPLEFEIFRYTLDAMLPVVNLHTYDRYYPDNRVVRVYAGLQHALGWFLITIFFVSAAIL